MDAIIICLQEKAMETTQQNPKTIINNHHYLQISLRPATSGIAK
jgi:hypothetical protein